MAGTAQSGSDDTEPSEERQAELRAAYEANEAASLEPYEGVEIRTKGELLWVMRERNWSGERYAGETQRAHLYGAILRGASLPGVHLHEANLAGAKLEEVDLRGADLFQANLTEADLTGAHLDGADLVGATLLDARLIEAHLSLTKLVGAYLGSADLSDADLYMAYLKGADLTWANLSEANLFGAHLNEAVLSGANFRGANLRGADLMLADLRSADLSETDLTVAKMSETDLSGADLSRADLSGADLRRARMVESTLEYATLTDCHVYGISAWNLRLEGAQQMNLSIGQPGDPTITVDDIEMAQFIYLMLHNDKIRKVIDTLTSKVVLILGRFTPKRKAVLDALREELRLHNFVPVLFDFDGPVSRDLIETVTLLARMACFIVADLTEPASIPLELEAIVPHVVVPVVPLIGGSERPFAMFDDLRRKYRWVMPIHRYVAPDQLLASLGDIIMRAEAKVGELRSRHEAVEDAES
jgi:uncharacterized protein YjbI with pentapeptide repeats